MSVDRKKRAWFSQEGKFNVQTGESYLCGQVSPPQHEAQRAAGEHGDERQRQQPVPPTEIPHVPPQILLHGTLEERLDSVPHGPPCVSRHIRTVVGARLLLAAR